MLERDTGLELSRATLDGWVLKGGQLLAAMREELIGGYYIQADETPVEVQIQEDLALAIERPELDVEVNQL